ncbi:Arc family DNA-binding protein [Stenotrophomonas sp. ATCM1_4]|nr:Arc family DNA-binding protein [Stenotrophomonas sp. ATCM1_4]
MGGRSRDAFMVRLPDGMRAHLKQQAVMNGRSMNSEIVHRLIESIAGLERMDIPNRDELVQIKLRATRDLHDQLTYRAAEGRRSMNSLIVLLLEKSLENAQ